MRKLFVGVGTAALLVLGCLAPSAASAATTPDPGPDPVPERHCVANLVTGKTACVTSQDEIEKARADAARLADGRSVAKVVHVATLFSGFLDQGSSLELQAGGDCTASKTNVDFTFPNIGTSSGFNDITSSFRAYGNCKLRLYDLASCPSSSATYPGASTWGGTVNYVGDAMNDKTTCVKGS